jgi:hypothetical protein
VDRVRADFRRVARRAIERFVHTGPQLEGNR